jgi:hypothetical protein
MGAGDTNSTQEPTAGTGKQNTDQPFGSIPWPRSGSDDGRSSGFGPLPRKAKTAQREFQIERSILFLLSGAATAAAQAAGPGL